MATHSSVLAWWAAVYGVAQSRTRLKRLSSSSSTGKAGNPFQTTQGIASPVAIRRGEGAQRKRCRDPRCVRLCVTP